MQETSAILADGGVWDDWDFPTSLFGPDCWSCTIAPRSTDLTQADGYGLYSMVEEARFRFGQHMGDIARNDGKGTRTPNRDPIMMVTVSMRYFHFAPLRYPDPVTIHMAMGAVGRSSTRTLARVSQGDTIICGVEGAQATMCEGRPHPMSEAQRENALRFLVHA